MLMMRTVKISLIILKRAFADGGKESMAITNARLLGALIKSFPPGSNPIGLIKYAHGLNNICILANNAVLGNV